MIKSILRKLGYIHESELTNEYILYAAANIIGDPVEYEFTAKQEEELFGDLSKVNGFSEYLNATMAKDMQRYFSSPREQLDIIQGAFARTAYIKSRIVKQNTSNTKSKTKLDNLRYG